jgi:hypothetical protein
MYMQIHIFIYNRSTIKLSLNLKTAKVYLLLNYFTYFILFSFLI